MIPVPYKLPPEDVPEANAFHLLGAFRETARLIGWPEDAIRAVIAEATSRDYKHLRNTLERHCA
jgi:hypothetical protein